MISSERGFMPFLSFWLSFLGLNRPVLLIFWLQTANSVDLASYKGEMWIFYATHADRIVLETHLVCGCLFVFFVLFGYKAISFSLFLFWMFVSECYVLPSLFLPFWIRCAKSHIPLEYRNHFFPRNSNWYMFSTKTLWPSQVPSWVDLYMFLSGSKCPFRQTEGTIDLGDVSKVTFSSKEQNRPHSRNVSDKPESR